MSAALGFFDLPVEIRSMIYRLLFCPSSEPILISFLLARSIKRSAQLLRVCRSCHEEAAPILYGFNQFALDWAFPGTESSILEFLERIGPKYGQLIRHLRVTHYSIWTLEKMRARRSLRPILENLESLCLEFYDENSFNTYWGPTRRNHITILRDVQRFLKTQRGPYRKLVRAFKSANKPSLHVSTLNVCLVSIGTKPNLEV